MMMMIMIMMLLKKKLLFADADLVKINFYHVSNQSTEVKNTKGSLIAAWEKCKWIYDSRNDQKN